MTDPRPFELRYRIRNTAEHFVAVGDTVTANQVDYRITAIDPARDDTTQILTFGMLVIPELVDITVEQAKP